MDIRIETFKQAFRRRKRGVKPARALFDILSENATCGRLKIKKDVLARALEVSERTVGNYIKTLSSLDLLKRKYSGETFLNPTFYYVGAEEELEHTKKQYSDFKSDI